MATLPVPGDEDYDPAIHGMPVVIMGDLAGKIDALGVKIDALIAAIEANTAAETGEGT